MGFVQSTHALDRNQLLLTVIGETTHESGYAHLVVPLPILTVGHTVDVLHDLIKSFGEFTMKPTNLYQRTESYGIDRIQAKIGLILSLTRQGGFVAKELHYDDVNLIMDGLQNFGSKRKRSVAATVGALFGLASFGSSIFNTAQLHRLNEDRQTDRREPTVPHGGIGGTHISASITSNGLWRDQYKSWVKHVKLIQETQRRTVMAEMGQQIHLLIQAFRMELTDFLTGVTRLMDHHLSPLLVQPKALEEAFTKIKNAARLPNMRPMSEDAGILFQVPTSTFSGRQREAFCYYASPVVCQGLTEIISVCSGSVFA